MSSDVIPQGETKLACTELVALAKDLILSGVAITGAVVAIKGLSTWQRQLKGKSEYDLSRRLLVSLFKYRDAINGVRHPAMWAYEMPSPPDDKAKDMSNEEISFYGTSKAYEARWDNVQTERTNLYADLLESEALWGTELKDYFTTLFKLEHELFTYIRNYLTVINPKTRDTKRNAIEKHLQKKRDIMYDDLNEDEDEEFKSEFKAGVYKIEQYLKPKLSYAGV